MLKEYKLVTAWSADQLEEAVMTALENSWRLKGGVSIFYNQRESMFQYTQAMARSLL